ncbi:MAG: DNA repair protein RecO [Gammaproteobacteria bacterium]|nr:DNA repair protein RecO [Gammaproteobacteria bacterium]
MRVQDQPAYILHQRPFRDTSQIIELFSRDYGRLSVISRGSRSAKSKLKSTLQLFQPLHVSWSGKGELPLLTRAEPAEYKPPVIKSRALPCGFYINELIVRLLHQHDIHEELFDLYHNVMYAFGNNDELEVTLRLFEKELLQLLGFGLNLVSDADSGELIDEQSDYIYYIEHGPVRVTSLVKTDQLIISGKSLLAYEKSVLDSGSVRREIKQLMRNIINYYIGSKPLRSRELFR